ncbi:hypothetical protein E4U42_006088 [Claviceps africana]|uniref:AB hydrolase-1 domain-containing protein n=1 Tax=Claviceps africana TaxID=83212 RepID=A0A8K0J5M8_9HYPO|nr:hypothetical protein E4U42_006088 [Claviceps africana]
MLHRAYGTAVWGLEPHSCGKAAVAEGRGGPLDLYWEVHGEGPTKILLVLGLGGTLSAWQIQTLYFGHTHGDKYSVLVFDNRGIGRSDAPLARYTTSDMARDAVDLLDHLGWTSPRQVNVVGISLGGMIAQELACLIPDRLQSLSLICTSAHVQSGKPFPQSVWSRLKLFRPKSEDEAIRDTACIVFPLSFLTAADDSVVLPSPRTTPRCRPADTPDGEYARFDSHFQRFQALELRKRHNGGHYTRTGFFCQLAAAAGHRKSPAQLAKMAAEVGRDRILVMHGANDEMIPVANAQRLISALEPGVSLIVDGLGHAPILERSVWFNEYMEERLAQWAKL